MNAERAKYFCVPQAVRNWRRKFWHLELSQGQSLLAARDSNAGMFAKL